MAAAAAFWDRQASPTMLKLNSTWLGQQGDGIRRAARPTALTPTSPVGSAWRGAGRGSLTVTLPHATSGEPACAERGQAADRFPVSCESADT